MQYRNSESSRWIAFQPELGRRVGKGELFAGYRRDDAPDDLDEPGTARVDDAGVTQDVEQLRPVRLLRARARREELLHVQL